MKTVSIVTLKLDRATKGAGLYKCMDEESGSPITTIYLRKDGFPGPLPIKILLTLAVDDEGDD